MSDTTLGYRCCACCEDIAKDDHVEHGGTVERDGHDLSCVTCGDEDRIRERLARAWDQGAKHRALTDPRVTVQGDNPYRVTPPGVDA